MTDRQDDPEEIWDPGGQIERTALAWTRTCLSYTLCALLCAKLAFRTPAAPTVALLGTAAASVLLSTVHRRYRRARQKLFAGHPVTPTHQVLLLTGMTMVLAVAAAALILAPMPH